jgi:TonB family protein
MKDESKVRFPVILLCSVVFHVGVVALFYVAWIYNVALKFGTFTFDSGGEARYKVAMIDRTKPLYLPKGFFAVEKPPEEVKKHEDRKTTDDKKKAAKDDEKDKRKDDDKKDEPSGKDDETKPEGEPKFGKIQGGALKPHLMRIYRAYEQGEITVSSFTVTVTCKAQRDGSLTDINLVKSSGDELIDQTAVNIVKELGAMKALGPLYRLSSLSITLQKSPSESTLTAVGFADDPDVVADFANQLSAIKFAAKFKMENPDQTALLNGVQIAQSGNRVSVELGLPTSTAGDMMRRSFGTKDTAKTGT